MRWPLCAWTELAVDYASPHGASLRLIEPRPPALEHVRPGARQLPALTLAWLSSRVLTAEAILSGCPGHIAATLATTSKAEQRDRRVRDASIRSQFRRASRVEDCGGCQVPVG